MRKEESGDKKRDTRIWSLIIKNGELHPLDVKMNAVRYLEEIMEVVSSFNH